MKWGAAAQLHIHPGAQEMKEGSGFPNPSEILGYRGNGLSRCPTNAKNSTWLTLLLACQDQPFLNQVCL